MNNPLATPLLISFESQPIPESVMDLIQKKEDVLTRLRGILTDSTDAALRGEALLHLAGTIHAIELEIDTLLNDFNVKRL